MATKRQQSLGEDGPASKRGKHSDAYLSEASSEGLTPDSSSPPKQHVQVKQTIETGPFYTQGHPPSISIIQPIDDAEEPPPGEPVIDLTGDTPSSKSVATLRASTPVEAYDTCFGMVG